MTGDYEYPTISNNCIARHPFEWDGYSKDDSNDDLDMDCTYSTLGEDKSNAVDNKKKETYSCSKHLWS